MQSLLQSMSPSSGRSCSRRWTRCCATTGCAGTWPSSPRRSISCCPRGWASAPLQGDEQLSLEGALAQLERLTAMDSLEAADRGMSTRPASSAELDRERGPRAARRRLGARTSTRSTSSRRPLEEAGYAERQRRPAGADAARRAPPRPRVLDELFGRLRTRRLRRPPSRSGGPWRRARGDGEAVRVRPAVRPRPAADAGERAQREENAPARRAGRSHPPRRPPTSRSTRTEDSTLGATVLLVDMSRSMLLRGCFLAAKKVAIALDMLIRTRYPHDELHVVGFAYYAREIAPRRWPSCPGTATSTARTSSTG